MKIDVDTGRGVARVSTAHVDGEACDSLLVLAHGAGADMHHDFMQRTAMALREAGIATLRFQFPYMERGRKPPDRAPVLVNAITAAVLAAAPLAAGRPVFAGGKSMGGRMTTLAAAQGRLDGVNGIVLFGFPLHPAGKISRERAAHLASVNLPMLFLQGTRDRLADLATMEAVCAGLPDDATLEVIEGADHSFGMLKSAGRSPAAVDAEIAAKVRAFVTACATGAR